MKIATSTYSFLQLMQRGEMTQFGCIAKAKELGFDGIELVDVERYAKGDVVDYAKRLGEEAERLGMPISNFTFGADFVGGSNGDWRAEVERVKKMIDLAKYTGAVSVRHDTAFEMGEFRSFGQMLSRLAEACREVTEYAAEQGIRTMVENHGRICQDSIRVEELFNAVNHPNFGILADMANFLSVDENPVTAYSRLAPYVTYAHAKDVIVKSGQEPNPGMGFRQSRGGNYLRSTIVGHGNVPVQQCVNILKCVGYDGFLAIEFEGMENALDALQIGLENLRNAIKD